MASKSNPDRLSSGSPSPKVSPANTKQVTSAEIHQALTNHTEDDLYMNESTAGVHSNSIGDNSGVANGDGSHDTSNSDDIVVLQESDKGELMDGQFCQVEIFSMCLKGICKAFVNGDFMLYKTYCDLHPVCVHKNCRILSSEMDFSKKNLCIRVKSAES